MNTCPVYRRSGGHSYQFTSPGPIGSVIAPDRNPEKYASLPFASTLCGSCTDVCPVKINLHEQLLAWRGELVKEGHVPLSKTLPMRVAGKVLTRPRLYRLGANVFKWVQRIPRAFLPSDLRCWLKDRDLPDVPKQSFRERMKQEREESP